MSDENSKIVPAIRLAGSKLGMRLFRNVRGMFYTKDGREIKAGLMADHSGDLVGWTCIEITPDMVGRTVAVYTEIEAKKSSWKKPTNQHERDQENRLQKIRKAGGIGAMLNDEKKLKKTIDAYIVGE